MEYSEGEQDRERERKRDCRQIRNT